MKFNFGQLTILIAALASPLAMSKSTGGLVNNGTGFVEQTLHYGYSLLKPLLENCVDENGQCGLTANQKVIARDILFVMSKRKDSSLLIKVVSTQDYPGLFDHGPNEPHRFAATGNSSDSFIFINQDLLLELERAATFTVGDAVHTLTHELGHMANYKGPLSHRVLDDLGALVRIQLEAGRISQRLPRVPESVVMNVIRPLRLGNNPEYIISLNQGRDQINLSIFEERNAKCRSPISFFMGAELENPAWVNIKIRPEYIEADFKTWVKTYCWSFSDVLQTSQVKNEYSMIIHKIRLLRKDGKVFLDRSPEREFIYDLNSEEIR